jgi:hypothetical protein
MPLRLILLNVLSAVLLDVLSIFKEPKEMHRKRLMVRTYFLWQILKKKKETCP